MGIKGIASGILTMVAAVTAVIGQTAIAVEDPSYNVASVVHESGTVLEVREAPLDAPLNGVHLFVDTDKGRIESYLAPASFLQEIAFKLDKKIPVHIYGSKVKVGAAYIVLAREVVQDNSTWYLRDERGNPYWKVRTSPDPEMFGPGNLEPALGSQHIPKISDPRSLN